MISCCHKRYEHFINDLLIGYLLRRQNGSKASAVDSLSDARLYQRRVEQGNKQKTCPTKEKYEKITYGINTATVNRGLHPDMR